MNELAISLPSYDEGTFSRLYAELASYRVEIPADPVSLGYDGINRLYSQVYAMVERVDAMAAEANRLVAQADAAYIAMQSAYDAKMDAKLAAAPKEQYDSVKVLEAKVRVELAEDLKSKQMAKLVLGLLKAYRKAVEGRHSRLESALKLLENQNQNLKRQIPQPFMGK